MELAQGSPLTQPAITKHLKVLENAGLIGRGRDGQRRPARLQRDGFFWSMTGCAAPMPNDDAPVVLRADAASR
ncbi:MAG: hypothetical protein WB439_07685, partial [Acidobacteriaceae bacterium]